MTKNNKEEKRKHYLVYQIDDNLNNMIYIGVHQTQNVKDKYMGSGVSLRKAFKEYGIENFSKTVLYDFENKEEMLDKEQPTVVSIAVPTTKHKEVALACITRGININFCSILFNLIIV
jgi:predicted dehydrogenase